MARALASTATAAVASTVATKLIGAARTWTKGYMDESIKQHARGLASQNNMDSEQFDDQKSVTLDEDAVSTLEDMKGSIGVLRNTNYTAAKNHFLEALLWATLKPNHFKECIKKSFDRCLDALGTVPTATDQIQVYSLYIASGFILYSDYGRNPIHGLRHIHNALRRMNSDAKLRKDLSTAFGSKLYWNGEQKELLRSVVLFSAQMLAFIVEVQQSIHELQNIESLLNAVCDDNLEQKAVNAVKHVISIKKEMKEKGDDIDIRALLKRDWVPRYETGYYFGNIGGNGFEYSILDEKQLLKLINLPMGQILFPKNGEIAFCSPNPEFQILCDITESVEKGDDAENSAIHQTQCGNKTLLTVTSNSMISDLRKDICKISGGSWKTFSSSAPPLCCNKEGLSDNKLISDYSIFPGDHLVFEQRMEMEYHRGRGHGQDDHSPNQLLDGNDYTDYLSKCEVPINEDWIIFKRTKNASFNMKHVMIRNQGYLYDYAIKSIVISTSLEDVDDQYIKWMEIKDINQGDKERQWFAVKEETGKEAKHKINFIRIDILENCGHKIWNAFKEFGIFGVSE